MITKAFALVAAVAGTTATLATVAAFFGDVWWGLDYLANFRWHLMWVAFAAAVLYALAGKGLLTAVFLVATAINAMLILPAWTGSQPVGSGEDAIRVTHIDISGAVDDMASIGTWLVGTDADLILVAGATADDIAALSVEGSPYVALTTPGKEAGVAVLGKGAWTITTTLTDDGQAVHRIAVPAGTGIVSVVTAWGAIGNSQSASEALTERLDAVGSVVDSVDGPTVVIGNLGATKWTRGSRTLLSATGLRDATTGAGYLPTWPHVELPIIGKWIGLPIDIVYMTPTITPLDVVAGPDIGTDHIPLTVDISPIAANS